MKRLILKTTAILAAVMMSTSVMTGAAKRHNEYKEAGQADTSATVSASVSARLAIPDSRTGAVVSVTHTPAIEQMIRKVENDRLREVKGFRIQIFSGNRGTASRNRAFEIKDILLAKEPTLDVYVTYTSPFWKVRVGNCASHDKAQELRAWMIEQFPDYATETYIVPSTVLVP
ncbi:MAG: hypothetical protein ACI3Z7_06290 [Candidatus Aphodosoma sp.]